MRALGIILAGGNNNKMRELSNKRAVAAMPVAGSFRSIDFALSSMANSHIQKVAVLTQYNARSLNEHLSSSKWWDFGRKHGGLFVFSPTVTSDNSWWYRGTADAISQNLTWLKNSHEPYVVIASGDGVYKLDFNKVLEYHIAKRADVTVVCTDSKEADTSRFGVLKMNEDCRIEEFEEKPMVSSSNVISTGIYVIRRRQLIEMIERSAQEDRYDFVKDILIRYKRMQGFCTLWLPGTDHASIATEAKVVEAMKAEGLTKEDVGREGFLQRAWAWREKYGRRIIEQKWGPLATGAGNVLHWMRDAPRPCVKFLCVCMNRD